MRFDISVTGLPSSLVSGVDLQQQWSAVSDPSGTIELSPFGFEPPHAASAKISATRVRMSPLVTQRTTS
jgi:hypothetical protein